MSEGRDVRSRSRQRRHRPPDGSLLRFPYTPKKRRIFSQLAVLLAQSILVWLLLAALVPSVLAASWHLALLPAGFLPIALFLLIRNLRRYCRQPSIDLDPDALHDSSLLFAQTIPYRSITEIRDFTTCLEVVFTQAQSPALWRLTATDLSPPEHGRFTAGLVRRVKCVNPAAAIYDQHTGPPP